MPRVKKSVVSVRESEAFKLLQEGKSVKDVNDALKSTHGFRMNLARIYELKRAIKLGHTEIPATGSLPVVRL